MHIRFPEKGQALPPDPSREGFTRERGPGGGLALPWEAHTIMFMILHEACGRHAGSSVEACDV